LNPEPPYKSEGDLEGEAKNLTKVLNPLLIHLGGER